MRLYRLPSPLKALVFDIDSTLYRHEEYARIQQELLIERLAKELGLSFRECADRIEEERIRLAEGNRGRRPSLGDTFACFGVPIPTSVAWREALIRPEAYLTRDDLLVRTMEGLAERFVLIALTNNPGPIGARTLAALGAGDRFRSCIGLEATMRSKPDPACFDSAVAAAGVSYPETLFIGDRYEIDLEYPLTRGSGALLAENMQDIYTLPQLLYAELDSGPQSGKTDNVTT